MKILGVYPVEAPAPCHLFEIEFDVTAVEYDWGDVTQETPGEPSSNWQVPWDERRLDDNGKRWIFFFHYLDFTRPLLTSEGAIPLPRPGELPKHLQDIKYEEP